MRSRGMIVGTMVAAGLALASREADRPQEADRLQPGQGNDIVTGDAGAERQFISSPAYEPKVPSTAGDHDRIRLANQKRARKAQRLLAAKAAGGIG